MRVKERENSVSVLLLRLQDKELLVPKAMVADVLSWDKERFFAAPRNEGNWKLGEYEWHGQRLPLVCFEKILRTQSANEELLKPKVVVLKACQPAYANKHYAIHCKGFPKPLILGEKSLDKLGSLEHQEWIAHSISIGSRVLDIPDFSALEQAVWYSQAEIHQSA